MPCGDALVRVLLGPCRQPNDMFAEFVKAGQPLGGLADEDLCVLAALGCGNAPAVQGDAPHRLSDFRFPVLREPFNSSLMGPRCAELACSSCCTRVTKCTCVS